MSTLGTLHSASREAYALSEQRLVEVAGTDNESLTTVGDELFEVVGLLVREATLRRALVDASTDPGRREQLVRRLLEGKVADRTLQVLGAVVTSRWSNLRELVDGIEALARTALLIRAERDGRLDAIEDELFRFARMVETESKLEQILSSPTGSIDGRVELVRTLLGGKVEPTTLTLVERLVRQLRGRSVLGGLEQLVDMAAQRRERSVAYVRTSTALSAEQQQRLASTLERIYARPIALHLEVDPDIGGGLVIRVGDEIIDGSTSGRLANLTRKLAG